MVIQVRAQGHLKQFRHDKQERFSVEVPDHATVRLLIEMSGIPWDEVGLVAVNGKQADESQLLSSSDEVMLMAPMEGG